MKHERERFSFLVILLPWLIVLLWVTWGLVGYNFFLSLTDWRGLRPSYNFAGFQNYRELPGSPGFLTTLKNSAILFFVGIPFTVVLSSILALLLDCAPKGLAGFARSIALLSMALGGVVVAAFWSWVLSYRYGGLNQALRLLGMGSLAKDWLGNPDTVLYAVILMLAWRFGGYGGLMILGGLQGVPDSQIESARISGATTWQVYRYILFPQVRGHILTATVLMSMFMLNSFDFVFPLTGGGPGYASTLFPVLVYRTMFEATNYAGGAAAATVLTMLVTIIAVPYILFVRRESKA